MLQRIFQYIFLFIVAGVLALIQFSLLNSLFWPWNNLDLIMVAIILAFLVFNREKTWLLAAASGWFLDSWGFHPFGLSFLSLFLSAVLVYFVLENVLTNRSLYSFLLLTAIGIIFKSFLFQLFLLIFDWSGSVKNFFLIQISFWESLFWSLLLGLLIVGLFFNLLSSANRRLQPFFLKRR